MNDEADAPLERPSNAPPLYAQDGHGYDAVVHAHYFLGGSDWLVTEYDPADDVAFGWACLNGDHASAELGYIGMGELDEVRVPLRINGQVTKATMRVERDLYWPDGLTLRDSIRRINARQVVR